MRKRRRTEITSRIDINPQVRLLPTTATVGLRQCHQALRAHLLAIGLLQRTTTTKQEVTYLPHNSFEHFYSHAVVSQLLAIAPARYQFDRMTAVETALPPPRPYVRILL